VPSAGMAQAPAARASTENRIHKQVILRECPATPETMLAALTPSFLLLQRLLLRPWCAC
jgi:hypothetical protein